MRHLGTQDLTLLRNAVCGANLKKLLVTKKISNYRLAKALGVKWWTVRYWIRGDHFPNDTNVLLLARYLGLIAPNEIDLNDIKKKLDELQVLYNRLSNSSKKGGENHSEIKRRSSKVGKKERSSKDSSPSSEEEESEGIEPERLG